MEFDLEDFIIVRDVVTITAIFYQLDNSCGFEDYLVLVKEAGDPCLENGHVM